MFRTLLLTAALALPLAPAALADVKDDAKARCIAINQAQVDAAPGAADRPADEKKATEAAVISICECVTARFAAMGDDGEKMLHVMAKLTAEQAVAGVTDPAADKKNITAILVADYAMSQADADAFFDRMNPEATKVGGECAAATATPAEPAQP